MAASCVPIFIVLLFLSSFCKSDDDTLTQAKPLFSSDKLVSKGGDFALGFFSPTSSNTSLYLGVWYNTIPARTVVWVANRDSPIAASSSATLAITNSSDLVLSDAQGLASWATKTNIVAGGAGTAAVLLDTGNFVLRSPNGTYIWQSFDHPTDTLIPSMKFVASYGAQVVGRLIAWKSSDDPSSGDFSCGLDPTSPALQMLIRNGSKLYYRGVWNGATVSGGTYSSNDDSIVYQVNVGQGGEVSLTLNVSDGSPLTRIVLEHTGKLTSLSWINQSWVVIGSRPDAACGIYSSCGPFGYCDFTKAVPVCQCLDGFQPNGLDVSSGCRRTETLTCSKQSHFVALPGMKVPDKSLHIPNRSFDDCTAECNSDCSCTAYAYRSLSSVIARVSLPRCLVWKGELIDTGTYPNLGENLYLRLADTNGRKKKTLLKIILPIISFLLILTFITLMKMFKYRGNRQNKGILKRQILGHFSSSSEITDKIIEFPFISFEDVVAATNNFSDSNQIGMGGFGKVYKGMIDGGKEVAIKRLSEGSRQGIEEFKNEIVLFSKLQHRNLVRLLGCCIHRDERLLIYEYLRNKSDAFIFDATRQHVLDWPTRFKIIKGVARGLLYLHQDSRLTIIHRDLKASNILLDTEMNPKISDFGMATIFGENQQQGNTARVAGTYGYMSPEYMMEGSFSVKSDTYSFGVLLLEIVSGLKISSAQLTMNYPSLTNFAWKLWEDGKACELVDSSIFETCPLHEVLRCIHVGLLCVEDHPNDRPLMSSVIFSLENESALLPSPKQPLYFAQINCKTKETRDYTENSMNTITITTLQGR
ncbi:LOW QUALITY PROTEIN: hypothetical protein CFC21_019237 [Triticum aestivum]|uniref:Receptor-like serine/threonine-protein kinase n=2 Tax=Triticum aestivum TaxID=4565 RepID=A0A3B6B576_WHEAT|nr:LOW QUALITY PROTEIN: hypothetical protein CFC21_019237 [Triticum aestivum]